MEAVIFQPWKVSDLNEYLKTKLDSDPALQLLCVEGEISGYVSASSGHSYFTLKDEKAALKAVFFRGNKRTLNFRPENGMKVLAVGDISVFPRDGVYQLYVQNLFQVGTGAEFLRLDELKRRLEAEGLFDPAHKKPLPTMCQKIGVVTSPTGAAIQDIRSVIQRRFPLATIVLYPARVQGSEAPAELTAGVRALDGQGLDVLLITRGGGSKEDLQAFNDEALAWAIYAARTPVVSAVGHEIDFTLVDLVSDRRAATPSAAAELVTPDRQELLARLLYLEETVRGAMAARIGEQQQALSACREQMGAVLEGQLSGFSTQLANLEERVAREGRHRLQQKGEQLRHRAEMLEKVNPLHLLGRGYGIIRKGGQVVRSAGQIGEGDRVSLTLRDGTVSGNLTDVRKEEQR